MSQSKYYQTIIMKDNLKCPERYCGRDYKIYIRSSYEMQMLTKFLDNPNRKDIIEWSSEDIVIKYRDASDGGRVHRYFLDFYFSAYDKYGNIKKYLIEVKPFHETKKPIVKNKRKTTQKKLIETYLKNQSKWERARQYAEQNNMIFRIITEKELFGK